MNRREWSNRVISTAEEKSRHYSSGQRHLFTVTARTRSIITAAAEDNSRVLLPAQSTWIWSSGGKAVHYSWGFSYSLDVPESNLVLLVWAVAMNIYECCSIFKHVSEYIASSKCQVNSIGVVLKTHGELFFPFSFCLSFFLDLCFK